MVGGGGGKGPTYPKRQLTENSASLRGNNESGILYRDPENTCSVVGQRAENHERDRPTTRHRPSGTRREQEGGGKGGNAASINQRVRPRFTGVARSFLPWKLEFDSRAGNIDVEKFDGYFSRVGSRCPSCVRVKERFQAD